MRDSVIDRLRVRDVLRLVGIDAPQDPRRLARCPLHDDGTPSLRVFDRGWRCFGCGKRGGILDLVIELGFVDDRAGAARFLEERSR